MEDTTRTGPPTDVGVPADAPDPILAALHSLTPGVEGVTIVDTCGVPQVLLPESGRIVDLLACLKQSTELAFTMLVDIVGIDYWDAEPRYGVVYNLHSLTTGQRITVKTRVSSAEAHLPTVTGLWSGANWMEREIFDLLGVRFEDHPDLRKILTPDDLEGHPLRKDFPLGNVDVWPEGADTVIAR